MPGKVRTVNVYPIGDPTGHTPGAGCVCQPTSEVLENGWTVWTHQELPE